MKMFRQALPGHALILAMLLSAPAVWAGVTITTGSVLPQATAGIPYVATLIATGGSAPYTWSLAAGALPTGLTLGAGGVITGTPSTVGVFQFIAKAADSATPSASNIAPFSITVVGGPTALAITTPVTLPNAMTYVAYSQPLAAKGGTSPYIWSLVSGALPLGLSLSSSGVISGSPTTAGQSNFSVQVMDSVSATATQNFSLTVSPVGAARTGVLSQVVSGGGWKTSIYLVNTSTAPVPVVVKFWSNTGTALTLPLTVTLTGGSLVSSASSVSETVAANATLLIESTSSASVESIGWAEVISTGPMTGYGVFHYTSTGGIESEGTLPLEASFTPSFILPYDGNGGFASGVALSNLMPAQTVSVTATVYNLDGSQLATKKISIPAGGHTSFPLDVSFPSTVGNRGFIEFVGGSNANITGLGLRINPAGGFTSIPNLARP